MILAYPFGGTGKKECHTLLSKCMALGSLV
jgi:hypothetical protein